MTHHACLKLRGPSQTPPPVPPRQGEASGKAANGLLHAIYETSRFKSSETGPKLESAELLFGGKDGAAAVQRAQAFVAGATLTRYLVEAPPNVCTPAHLAQAAEEIAESAPDVYQLKVPVGGCAWQYRGGTGNGPW